MVNEKNILLHVGFHKSGSTFVQNYFEQHPSVFFSRSILANFIHDHQKEIPPFEHLTEHKYIFLSDMRLTVNSWGKTEFERIRSNSFSQINIQKIQEQIAINLKNRFPHAKILITIREKEQLLPSLYSQYIINGGTKTFRSFKQDPPHIRTLFDYENVGNIYKRIFGVSNVYILPYKLLKQNPDNYIQSICSIGNFPYSPQNFKIINSSLSSQKLIWTRIMNICVTYSLFLFPKTKRNKYFSKYVNQLVSKKHV